ncbi:MAG TPA: protein kinase [Polyangiaceae bacterium]
MSISEGRRLGRYAIFDSIAAGGMATVHFGRLVGEGGFARTVAIKRLHAQYAQDPEFATMFLDEARLASRIRHPNVVVTLDVVAAERELYVVLEYVHGESFAKLLRASRDAGARPPPAVVSSILAGVLHGLHAAHEATNDRGEPLGIVHRDVSPQNVVVGADGVARVLDFGVAKAADRLQTTQEGRIKGKLAYMAPEQARGARVDRRSDVYAAGIVLWEGLTGTRLFAGDSEASVLERALHGLVQAPGTIVPELPEAIDAVVMRALDRDPAKRFATAREMALALERAIRPATQSEVGDWVEATGGAALATRAERIAAIERQPEVVEKPPPPLASAPVVEGATIDSGVALAASDAEGSRARRPRRVVVVGLAAAMMAVGALAVVAAFAGRHPTSSAPPANAAASTPSIGPEPTPVASSPSLPPVASTPSSAPPPASLPATPAPARPRVARPGPAPSAPCVPYTIAPDGTRVYNRGCLK